VGRGRGRARLRQKGANIEVNHTQNMVDLQRDHNIICV
jgi:hypothetical protein